jgi:hypothetical protein
MRLLHHAPLSQWKNAFPDAWDHFKSQQDDLFKRRTSALRDFHALFPFLPVSEHPVSWETKAKR